MRGISERVRVALDSHGAVLIRQRKHYVFRLRNGRNVVLPASGSDSRRGEWNALCQIRKAAGAC